MTAKQPYNLMFGKEPKQVISRTMQKETILDSFREETCQVYIITGVRGSGKTVLMTEISKQLQSEDWEVAELNPKRDMLLSLAAKLSSKRKLAEIFKKAKLNLSFFNIDIEVAGGVQITDIEIALSEMLAGIKKHGKKVLITVDEAISSEEMQIFANTFQILVRQDLPVYLLMTGLYENIHELQNEKTLTFLYRAPKIELNPLNINTIRENYKKNLDINDEVALKMAQLTKGYAFAFQVLGYFTWVHKGLTQEVLVTYRQYLEEYVYDKIWSELSLRDKKIAYGIACTDTGKVSDIRETLGIDNNKFNPYRKRLINKGIVDGKNYGYITFTLPLFDEFVKAKYMQEQNI